ncbi:hypothetical protein MPLA_1100043 [Mesorhizobium sp. ORS 3359]|nr:hypothetical protein MPLA_1100043 [Mesorhizobium sp. ORS 3359]
MSNELLLLAQFCQSPSVKQFPYMYHTAGQGGLKRQMMIFDFKTRRMVY